ncbi:hypothetical protein [Prosthecobacter sp.]|uniref:hypothetical protein n=1 Tax=Prosthecobacter sp. TaxID=1965333 RepID=UPI0037844138
MSEPSASSAAVQTSPPLTNDRPLGLAEGDAPLTGLEKARATFYRAGLAFPQVPEELAAALEEKERWVFSTREVTMWEYDVDRYVEERVSTLAPFALLAHSGHGINSYAIQYYLFFGPLRLFLHLAFGGIYSNEEEDAANIRECFALADEIVAASAVLGDLPAGDHLTIVCTDFYGSDWARPGRLLRRYWPHRPHAAEVLTEVLTWLRGR